MGDHELITASLERAAERTEDLTPRVFERFFALRPGARALFVEPDDGAKGRMLNDILSLLLDQAECKSYVGPTVITSTRDHSSWGVDRGMYGEVFTSLLAELRSLVGEAWDTATEAAWQRQVDALLALTREAYRPLTSGGEAARCGAEREAPDRAPAA